MTATEDRTTLDVHPVAALFPMLADDELADMAADIKERGLLQPITLDAEGRILDGRNRYAACQLAGVAPVFVTYEGDDPDGYALAVNVERRSLKPSQKHMIKEMARRQSGLSKLEISSSAADATSMSDAATVLDHAPDLAREVVAGTLPLYKAVELARENKKTAQIEAAKRDRLKREAADLLSLVDDDQLSMDDAIAVLNRRITAEQQRVAEEQRQAQARQSEEEAAKRLAEQEHQDGIRRSTEALTAFLIGWDTAFHLHHDPNREDTLAALSDYDRERFLEIEAKIK